MVSQSTKRKLDEELSKRSEELNIPGMALAVYQNGESIYENYYGYRNIKSKLPVTKDTIFGLASVTKSLTSFIVLKLAEEGKIDKEDKLKDWLPNLKWPRPEYENQLTIQHLMSHTSGLPGLPLIHHARLESIEEDPHGAFLFEGRIADDISYIRNSDELIAALNGLDFELLGPPGEIFNYSNEGYGLLQEVIEAASGRSFIDCARESIFEPLDMNDSYFLTESILKRKNVSELYAYNKGEIFHSPYWWDVGSIYTNGSWKASSNDVMKFAELLRLNDGSFISGKDGEDMIARCFDLPNGGKYGCGLEINSLGKYKMLGHGGSIKGVSSNFQVIQEAGISASILINMADVPAEKILVFVLRTILNISEKKLFHAYDFLETGEVSLNGFSGKYRFDEGPEVLITIEHNVLLLERGGQFTKFYPISKQDFISADDERIYFHKYRGSVISIMLGKRVLKKVK